MKRLLRQRMRRKVVATLKDGQAFAGVLFDVDKESMVLRDAEVLGEERRVLVDGEVLILRADLAYLQVI